MFKYRIIFIILIFFIISFYLFSQLLWKESVLSLLNSNLPFREVYHPTLKGILIVYIFPLIIGYIVGGLLQPNSRTNRLIYFINLSLLFGVSNFVPFLFDTKLIIISSFSNLSLIYLLLIVPMLFLLGTIPHMLNDLVNSFDDDVGSANLSINDLCLALGIGIASYLLNIIPAIKTQYLVGADIYYHATLASRIANFSSLFNNPIFIGEKNYYISLGYFLISFISRIGGFSIDVVIRYILPIFASIFLFFIYLFAKRLSKSVLAAFLAIIFILPFNQILWYDPSLRIISFGFFAIFLYSFQSAVIYKQKIFILPASLCFLCTVASHPEIAIHALIIMITYICLASFIKIRNLLTKSFLGLENLSFHLPGYYSLEGLLNYRSFLVLIVIYLILLQNKISFLINNYSITNIMVVNEISFSALQPIGPISLIVFLFLPFSVIKCLLRPNKSNILLLSISLLFLFSIFYFTHLWIFYHRYFTETAYIGLAISAAIIIANIYNRYLSKYWMLFTLAIGGFLVLSLLPKYKFIDNYSDSVHARLINYSQDLSLIKSNTVHNSVIVIFPDDMINRYVPFYTQRYIYAGSNTINKEHQWQVLSFCNGPFNEVCTNRLAMADQFFNSPSHVTLSKLKGAYQADYLLVNKSETNSSLLEFSETLGTNLNKGETKDYILYDIRKI
jgi:hypothetical protein